MKYEPIPDLNLYLSDKYCYGFDDIYATCFSTLRIVIYKLETGFYYYE